MRIENQALATYSVNSELIKFYLIQKDTIIKLNELEKQNY